MNTETMIRLYIHGKAYWDHHTLPPQAKDFTETPWGNPLGELKYPASFVKRWTIKDETDEHGNKTGRKVFDEYRAFQELAIIAIMYLRRNYPVLRQLGVKFEILPREIKEGVRDTIFRLMADLTMNRNIWLKTNTSSISLPNFTLSPEANTWILPIDAISLYVEASAYDAGLNDLEVIEVGDGEMYKLEGRDQVIISKWEDIPDGNEFMIKDILEQNISNKEKLTKIMEVING